MYVQLSLDYKVRKYIFTQSGALYIHENVEPGTRLNRVRVQSVHTYVQNIRAFICTSMRSRAPDCTCIQKSV